MSRKKTSTSSGTWDQTPAQTKIHRYNFRQRKLKIRKSFFLLQILKPALMTSWVYNKYWNLGQMTACKIFLTLVKAMMTRNLVMNLLSLVERQKTCINYKEILAKKQRLLLSRNHKFSKKSVAQRFPHLRILGASFADVSSLANKRWEGTPLRLTQGWAQAMLANYR